MTATDLGIQIFWTIRTRGASTKLRRMARASGTKISWPR